MTDGAASDWTDGYVVDVEYVRNFLPGLAPLNLALAAVSAGVRPPDVDQPFAYLDLGCGNGFTPALLAAANPHAEVWGNDFNPAHIRNARATAVAAGIANARFVEAGFADLPRTALPMFDIVAVHGLWSWVSAANRARIVDLLERYLKPGGLAVISYNCHSAADMLLPLRRLMIAEAAKQGAPGSRIERALAAARRLRDAGAGYFADNPLASAALERMERADPAYLAHEYLSAEWSAFYPGEVAAAVAPVGLAYVGQAKIADNVDRFWMTPEQQALIDAETDPSDAEALRDLILGRRFRRDLFVRDGVAASEEERAAWFANRRFALAKPRGTCSPASDSRAAPESAPSLLEAVLDALAAGPTALGAPSGVPALAKATQHDILEALSDLSAMGLIQPALSQAGEPARRAATERFNAAALASARSGEPVAALASPVTGSGISLSLGDQLLLDVARSGVPLDLIATEDASGKPKGVERFRRDTLPLLATLGIA